LGLVVGLVATPVSPLALWQGDARLATVGPVAAVASYDAIARSNPIASVRREALVRSATVWGTDLRDASEARIRLTMFIQQSSEPGRIAWAWEQIATGWLNGERRPGDAADAFRLAYDAAPDALLARERLERAAHAHTEAGNNKKALATWEQLGDVFPESVALAHIGQGRIYLAKGDTETALTVFDDALETAADQRQASVARLGIATCLERLGNLDGALAELDQAELPGRVRTARRDAMRARAQATPF
jgi:tetratricopeptide (TPR) repeat protein